MSVCIQVAWYICYIPQLKEKLNHFFFSPFQVVSLNCRSFDLRLANTEGLWTTFHHAQKYLGAYLLATKTLKLIKWLTSTAHSSGALSSHPRQTQLKVNIRTSDKSGLCCGCHQRLVVVHTNFLTYLSNLLSNLCHEWQPSLKAAGQPDLPQPNQQSLEVPPQGYLNLQILRLFCEKWWCPHHTVCVSLQGSCERVFSFTTEFQCCTPYQGPLEFCSGLTPKIPQVHLGLNCGQSSVKVAWEGYLACWHLLCSLQADTSLLTAWLAE